MYNAGPAQPLALRGSNGVTSKAPRHTQTSHLSPELRLVPAPRRLPTSLVGALQGTCWGLALLLLFTSLSPGLLFFSYLKILNF